MTQDPNDFRRCHGSNKSPRSVHHFGALECSVCASRFVPQADSLVGWTVPEHIARDESSAQYIPRLVDLHGSALLKGCAMMAVSEETVIDMLAERVRELEEALRRAVENRAGPMIVCVEGEKPVAK